MANERKQNMLAQSTVVIESGMWCSMTENQRNTNSRRSDIETTTTQFSEMRLPGMVTGTSIYFVP